jgi:hypothetical protein
MKVGISAILIVWAIKKKLTDSFKWSSGPTLPSISSTSRNTKWSIRSYPQRCSFQSCRFFMKGFHAQQIVSGWKRYFAAG